jgi:GTP diphosphokinase / guanosine-3',5'-bis(diphosphate) 3'-diphosphatase
MELTGKELLGKRVFVFLRDGKILNLLRGATIIDAAFAIHTEVGLRMSAADINGQRKPLSYELINGDVVSILTDPASRPSLDWMRFSRARSTRAKLRAYFRSQQRAANVQKGGLYIQTFLKDCQSLVLERHGSVSDVNLLLKSLGHENVDEVCLALAQTKTASLRATLAQLFALRFEKVDALFQLKGNTARGGGPPAPVSNTAPRECDAVRSFVGNPASVCPKCMPVLGDAVVGVLVGGACTIHLPYCNELRGKASSDATVPVVWGAAEAEEYSSELQVLCLDRKFLLRDVSDVVALESQIVRTSSQTIGDKAVLNFKVLVSSAQQLSDLVSAILRVPGVTSCERMSA